MASRCKLDWEMEKHKSAWCRSGGSVRGSLFVGARALREKLLPDVLLMTRAKGSHFL